MVNRRRTKNSLLLLFVTALAAFGLLTPSAQELHHQDRPTATNNDSTKWYYIDNEDATLGSGNYSMIGKTQDAHECQDKCEAVPACTIFSWNKHSSHCWLRYDGVWSLQANERVTSACIVEKVKGCGPPHPPPKMPSMVLIPGGEFTMGYSKLPIPSSFGESEFPDGDADEKPYHKVTVSDFMLSETEVTNLQYEQFDPSHKDKRAILGFSANDDDPVLFVSWYDAVAYTEWLSNRTGQSYRLPTEAEWEYAARGNTSTREDYFWTGDTIPSDMLNNQKNTGIPTQGLTLTVARFKPNGFGLYDTIGNVEEWVWDWYGPYPNTSQTDPAGPPSGTSKVTRGGSHSTDIYYLRSANRASALPHDRSWYIGFRVAMDTSTALASSSRWHIPAASASMSSNTGSLGVQSNSSWPKWSSKPMPPKILRYVNIPSSTGKVQLPFEKHNHEPTIAACPDGSVLASWYSTECGEPGRCVGLVSARLELNATEWPTAEVMLDIADRCQCCTALYFDRDTGILYHFSAVSAAATYDDIAVLVRNSTDCGRTFSTPEIVLPNHGVQHQVVVTVIKNSRGEVMVPCDHWGKEPYQELGDQSVIQHAPLQDIFNQSSWHTLSPINHNYTNTGSHHTSLVELRNGSYVAVGRGHDIDGTMAFSYSLDGGYTWAPHKSSFPGIHGGQREVMIRLGSIDQPIMTCSFANDPMDIPIQGGGTYKATGLYCAISDDEGETFPARRLMTDNWTKEGYEREGFDGNKFKMSYNTAEPDGYLAATVADDGTIHLISSRNHYAFNLAWLRQPSPKPPSQ